MGLSRGQAPGVGAVTDLAVILGAIVAGILGALGYGHNQRRAGRQDQKDKANADAIKRRKAGQEAVRDGRDSGNTPDERVRRNDGSW